MQKLYPTHIPLHSWQKVILTMEGAIKVGVQRDRADLVALVGETTGNYALKNIHKRMLNSVEGQMLLKEQPRVDKHFFDKVSSLPDTTLGGQYYKFMQARKFHPDQRPPVRYVDDVELAYIMQRYREIHDIWHVIFSCHTNFFGEFALKALEHVQTGLPMPFLAVSGTFLRLQQGQRIAMITDILPWSLRAGSKSRDLMTIYYEKYLDKDLVELRRQWKVETIPKVKYLEAQKEEFAIL